MPPAALSARIQADMAWFSDAFRRHVAKENSVGPAPIDLGTAENRLAHGDMVELLQRAAADFPAHLLCYAKGLGANQELLHAAAAFFNSFFRPRVPVCPEHIVAGPGASALLETLAYSLCADGDAILVEAPYWSSFNVYSTVRNHVQMVPVHCPPPPCSPAEYVACFRNALRSSRRRVRAILLCNPQNPQAHIHARGTIEALLQFCEEADLHFVSDEIYALSAFGPLPGCGGLQSPSLSFDSVLAMDLERLRVDASRVHLLYSISKDFGSSGLRMGFVVTQAHPELRYSLSVLNFARFSNAASWVATRLLGDLPEVQRLVDVNRSRLRTAATLAVRFLDFHDLPFYQPAAGLYVWARLGPPGCSWEDEARLLAEFAAAGVFVGAGGEYSSPEPGWFRLTFAIPRDELVEALRRIERVLGVVKHWRPDA
ncbi:PLP-dependent transferase [Lasiodiplodia theobromae]|uniref:PLP-dependent transferase n=1 Tax=Lasiodiplodia theobromae TaxID=45133 RepID=UPI0015C3AAD3|nr:PLP-dependent transferase [Lasiodiplodia theobromae]KAF4542001.1 PLP-dependent transferase [Lasiodiplodia theobromae]